MPTSQIDLRAGEHKFDFLDSGEATALELFGGADDWQDRGEEQSV